MRAAFDQTMTVRYGSRSVVGPPGDEYVSGVLCRVIDQNEIEQHQFDFSYTDAWVTVDAVELNGPLVTSPSLGTYYTDQLSADEVMFDNEPDVWYSVCRKERVLPFGRPPYWRYLLLPLLRVAYPDWPPPVPLPCPECPAPPGVTEPGTNCSNHTLLTDFRTYTLRSNAGFFIGTYSLQLTFSGLIRFRLVEPINADVRVAIKEVLSTSNCCSGVVYTDLDADGLHCASFAKPSPSTSARKICLEVQSLTGEGPATITVAVETGAC